MGGVVMEPAGLKSGGGSVSTDVRQLLFEVAQLLFAGAAPSAVLERIVTVLCAQLGYDRCLIAAVTRGTGGQIFGQVGHGVRNEDVLQVAEMLEDVPILHSLMCMPGPHVLASKQIQAAIPKRYVDLFGVAGTLVLVPLIDSRLGPLGLLFLDRKGREFYPPLVTLATLGEFGEIATLAVQNAVLLQDRASLVAMVERSRLAGELHDGVTQRMFTLSLTLKELAELPAMPPGADQLLDRAQRDVDAAGSQLRRALTQLTERAIPATRATSEGFEERLRHIVAEANAEYGLLADIELSGQGRTPAPERQRVMLRALQESLVNIAKHAEATQVTVAMRRSDHHWVMEVHDDGRGQARQVRRGVETNDAHFGLRSLRHDMEASGGRLWISQSERLGGLQVTISAQVQP